MKVITHYNYDREESRNYKDYGTSETEPDMTMSIRTILEKYASDQPIEASQREPIWDEDAQGIDPRSLDLTDREQIIKNGKQAKQDQKDLAEKSRLRDLQAKDEQSETKKHNVEDVTVIEDIADSTKPT